MLGDCYPTAARAILANDPPGAVLAHGTVTGQGPAAGRRFGHAWVEVERDGITWAIDRSNGNDVTLPAAAYYKIGRIDPREVVRYDADEAIDRLGEHLHYGPWHEEV